MNRKKLGARLQALESRAPAPDAPDLDPLTDEELEEMERLATVLESSASTAEARANAERRMKAITNAAALRKLGVFIPDNGR